MNFNKIKKSICCLLMVTVNVMTMNSLTMSTAMAAPVCSAYGANSPTAACTTFKAGTTVVGVPRLQWNLVSEDLTENAQKELATLAGNHNELTGNTAANLRGLSSNEVASAVAAFPANVPMVVGRFEPMSNTLRVDIFKIERSVKNGKPISALYQTTFSPNYGDYWKAMGTYLSPAERQGGTAVGPNPFAAFSGTNPDTFNNISIKGAMVVLGHAQRYVGAPLSLLINHLPKTEQYTKKGGNIFRKKVTTFVDFSAKPEYFLGAPMAMQGGMQASFCANDPTATSCEAYQAATSGVGFMKIEGGNLAENSTFVHQWSETKKGWTLLAVFVVAFVFGFAAAAIGPALSATVSGATSLAPTTIGAGFWSNLLSMAGIGSSSAAGAAAIEAGIYTTVTAAKGSGFGGVYGVSGVVNAQEKALNVAIEPSHVSAREYRDKMIKGGATTGGIDNALTPVRQQLVGSCGSGTLLKNCSGPSGILPRGDGYISFDGVEFMRDNGQSKAGSGSGY
jgi:hypothetical protein